MDIEQLIKQLPWRLIVALGLFALIRPLIKVFGDVFGYSVSPLMTLVITAAIAIIWIGVVVKLRVEKPVIVLAMSGAVYAVASIVLAVVIQVVFPDFGNDEVKILVLLTAALIATTIFNFIYGAFLGLIASVIQKALNKPRV